MSLDIREENGRTYVEDYEVTEVEGIYLGKLIGELTEGERYFTVQTQLRADSFGGILTLIGNQLTRRETIRKAYELGQQRIAEEKAFKALRNETGDVPFPADG